MPWLMQAKSRGTDPKNLRVFSDFGASVTLRGSCGARAKGRVRRGDFRGGADTTGEIRFTSVRPRRKQKRRILFAFGMSCSRDHRKRQSERSPAGAVSIALRDHRLPENANIEKVGPTYFLNMFRTEFSFSRFVMTMVCKLL